MRRLLIIICAFFLTVLCAWAAWPHSEEKSGEVHEETITIITSSSGSYYKITDDKCGNCFVDKQGVLRCGKCNGYFNSGEKIGSGSGYTKYFFTCLNKSCKHTMEAKLCY